MKCESFAHLSLIASCECSASHTPTLWLARYDELISLVSVYIMLTHYCCFVFSIFSIKLRIWSGITFMFLLVLTSFLCLLDALHNGGGAGRMVVVIE